MKTFMAILFTLCLSGFPVLFIVHIVKDTIEDYKIRKKIEQGPLRLFVILVSLIAIVKIGFIFF